MEDLTKKRWRMLVACCIANLCLGCIYSWSAFATPLSEYLTELNGVNITVGDLSVVYVVASSVGPATMISGGWIIDKFGPRKIMLLGSIMTSFGLFLSGFAKTVSFLMVSFGLVFGLGLGLAYGCTVNSCIKLFPDRRGFVGGITTATYGLSSVILPPVVTAISYELTPMTALKILGITFFAILSICSVFIVGCPGRYASMDRSLQTSDNVLQDSIMEADWKKMIKTPIFYIMLMLLITGAFSGMMVISQVSAIAIEMVGLSVVSASVAVSVLALFNVSGRLIAGVVSDKIGQINTLTGACIISAIGLMSLYFSSTGDVFKFYIGISLVGICFGSFMGVFPGFTAYRFGSKNNSVNYGIMFIGVALAGCLGPIAMNNIYVSDGMYQRAFLVALGLNIAGIALIYAYKMADMKLKNI